MSDQAHSFDLAPQDLPQPMPEPSGFELSPRELVPQGIDDDCAKRAPDAPPTAEAARAMDAAPAIPGTDSRPPHAERDGTATSGASSSSSAAAHPAPALEPAPAGMSAATPRAAPPPLPESALPAQAPVALGPAPAPAALAGGAAPPPMPATGSATGYTPPPPPLEPRAPRAGASTPPPLEASRFGAPPPIPAVVEGAEESKRVLVGMLAILFGFAGLHKFVLGYREAGVVMLLVTFVGGLCTSGMSVLAAWVVGVIEGVVYLSKSDVEFVRVYQLGRREWF
ncbi:MAG: hypothetical protein RL112_921 [Planctomycetota bacterium]|jgi:TM2 domain-containing membrane protein YozV